jgi:hypothetical protein
MKESGQRRLGELVQDEYPLSEIFGTSSVSVFFFLILEYLHVHIGISWSWNPVSI